MQRRRNDYDYVGVGELTATYRIAQRSDSEAFVFTFDRKVQ
jgi:hypothetical protein